MPRLIVGLQPVREAIRVHAGELERVLVQRARSSRTDALARFATDHGIAVDRASRQQLDQLARGVRHQGVAAFAPELELRELSTLRPDEDSPLVVLDGITDPQNFGATLRSAVALGSGALLWAEHHAAPLSPATFRASAGAVEHARLYRVASLRQALGALRDAGYVTVALDPSAGATLAEAPLGGRCAIVIGAEDRGVRRSVARACDVRARLAMTGPVQSLNASVAAAVALYEIARSREGDGTRKSVVKPVS